MYTVPHRAESGLENPDQCIHSTCIRNSMLERNHTSFAITALHPWIKGRNHV